MAPLTVLYRCREEVHDPAQISIRQTRRIYDVKGSRWETSVPRQMVIEDGLISRWPSPPTRWDEESLASEDSGISGKHGYIPSNDSATCKKDPAKSPATSYVGRFSRFQIPSFACDVPVVLSQHGSTAGPSTMKRVSAGKSSSVRSGSSARRAGSVGTGRDNSADPSCSGTALAPSQHERVTNSSQTELHSHHDFESTSAISQVESRRVPSGCALTEIQLHEGPLRSFVDSENDDRQSCDDDHGSTIYPDDSISCIDFAVPRRGVSETTWEPRRVRRTIASRSVVQAKQKAALRCGPNEIVTEEYWSVPITRTGKLSDQRN